jgi:hypothetical protein
VIDIDCLAMEREPGLDRSVGNGPVAKFTHLSVDHAFFTSACGGAGVWHQTNACRLWP